MVNTPQRLDAPSLPLPVSQQQRRNVREREGDVFKPAAFWDFGGGVGDSDEGYAVVFVVVGDEGDHFVAVGDGAAEEGGVEGCHALQVGGA